MSAIRLARAVTGRDKVIKFAGAYHGHVDGLLAEAGSGLATQGIPASPGVPEAATAGDGGRAVERLRGAIRAAVEQHAPAAILAEPYPANMGLVPPPAASSSCCASSPTESGALLVFDEVISGFRVAPGGAQELRRRHARPDRDGQGHRRRAARRGVRRAGRAAQPHRAGRRRLPGGHAEREPARGRRRPRRAPATSTTTPTSSSPRRRARSPPACARRPAPARSRSPRRTGLLTVFFSAEPVTDYAGAAACDTEAHAAWCRALLARGVYPPPSQFEAWFPSLAHTPEHVERTLEAAAAAFAEVDMNALEALAATVRAEGGLLADTVTRSHTGRRARRAGRARLRGAGRGDLRGLPPALRRGARPAPRAIPTSRCSPATACTRSGWPAWPSWGTSKRSTSWPA